MISPTHIYLLLIIVGGGLGILSGVKSRSEKASLSANKPVLRGCLMIASGAIFMALVLGGVLRDRIAVTTVAILIVINEYVMMMLLFRSRKQPADFADLAVGKEQIEMSQDDLWRQLRAKGRLRYVLISALLYGCTGGLFSVMALVLMPTQIPSYMPIAIALAGALGGGIAAQRQWDWHESNDGSVEKEPKDRVKGVRCL